MALGKRKPVQQPLFVATSALNVLSHPFYQAVNQVIDAHHFTASWSNSAPASTTMAAAGGGPGWRRASTSAACWSGTSTGSTPSAALTGAATTASGSSRFGACRATSPRRTTRPSNASEIIDIGLCGLRRLGRPDVRDVSGQHVGDGCLARSYCQKSWMKPEPQAASFVPSLKITPSITAGSNVLPLSFRQWF